LPELRGVGEKGGTATGRKTDTFQRGSKGSTTRSAHARERKGKGRGGETLQKKDRTNGGS